MVYALDVSSFDRKNILSVTYFCDDRVKVLLKPGCTHMDLPSPTEIQENLPVAYYNYAVYKSRKNERVIWIKPL